MKAALNVTRSDGTPLELHFSTKLPGDLWIVEARTPSPAGTQPFYGIQAGETLPLEAAQPAGPGLVQVRLEEAVGGVLVKPAGEMEPLKGELDRGGCHTRALLLHPQAPEEPPEAWEIAELGEEVRRGHEVRGLRAEGPVEPGQELREVEPRQPPAEYLQNGVPQSPLQDLVLASLFDRVELHSPERTRDDGPEIHEARDRFGLAGSCGAPERGRDQGLEVTDRVPDRDAAVMVHLR